LNHISKEKHTRIVKDLAKKHGFDFCGISKAEFLEEEARNLETWLNRNYQGKMAYLANHFDKRLDPTKLVPGAKSVVSLIYNYYPKENIPGVNNFLIAKYAYGTDYHFVIKRKLKDLFEELQSEIGEVSGRLFVDSAPVMERQWAARSGLGWLGKNTLLLNREMGSFFFLSELITDLELIPDGPAGDYCGTCTKCLDACPTDAFVGEGILDASKCISYLTIELKDEIPSEFSGKMENWIFGCDICQDVCPWNRFSKPHSEQQFEPSAELREFTQRDWQELTKEVFDKIFRDSPVQRTKFEGLKRNVSFVNDKGHLK